jgi:hypothetical protein
MEFVDWTIRTVKNAFVSRLEIRPDEEEDKRRLNATEEATDAFKSAFKDFEVLPKIVVVESHFLEDSD